MGWVPLEPGPHDRNFTTLVVHSELKPDLTQKVWGQVWWSAPQSIPTNHFPFLCKEWILSGKSEKDPDLETVQYGRLPPKYVREETVLQTAES